MSELGDKLRKLRQKYIDDGGRLYSAEEIRAELDQLEAPRAEQVAPDMVLVPRVPTEKLQAHLTGMLVASCNCDTKPPDVEYHEIWCRYRQTSEAVELIDAMLAAAPGAAK